MNSSQGCLTIKVVVLFCTSLTILFIWSHKTRFLEQLKFDFSNYPTFRPFSSSLARHRIPKWWKEAKLGIFVHWGVYSVPGFAPTDETPPELLRTGKISQFEKMKGMPYAEWYKILIIQCHVPYVFTIFQNSET